MTNKPELLPCPFCGVEPHQYPSVKGVSDAVTCTTANCPCDQVICGVNEWNTRAAPAEDVRAVVEEPVRLTAVATLRDDGDGGLEADWLLEGGTSELFEGMILLVADNDPSLCEEDGSAEVYRHPQRPVVLPERLRGVWLFLDGQAELEGCVFGEKPEGRHNFWWRKELRAVLEELYPAQ
jgi:hypothetical protein